MSEPAAQPKKKLQLRPKQNIDINQLLAPTTTTTTTTIPVVSEIPATVPVKTAPVQASVPATAEKSVAAATSTPATVASNAVKKPLKVPKKSVGNGQEAGIYEEESKAPVVESENMLAKISTQKSIFEEKAPSTIGRPAVSMMESSSKSVEVTQDLITYFLDKDQPFDLEDDGLFGFNKRLIIFLQRSYESSGAKDMRNPNKHQTARPYTNGKSGNTFPVGDLTISRGDSKKLTTPGLGKQHSSNNNNLKLSQSQSGEGSMKRQEEDKDVIDLKLKIKEKSAQFLEKMRTDKQDQFKKQISDIRLNLNILTPTNFDKIKRDLFELCMLEQILCEHVVEGIIEKARTQKTYSGMYADLCKYIITESKTRFPDKADEAKQRMFKDHLYNNIQQTFEGEKDVYNNKMTFAKHKTLSQLTNAEDKMIYFMDKKKREMLNVQFIGNLFLNKSMNLTIINLCCSFLLDHFFQGLCSIPEEQRDTDEVEEAHYEDHIEALIALYEQTGPKMLQKHEQNSKKKNNTELVNAFTQKIIDAMKSRTLTEVEKKNLLDDTQQFNYDDFFTIFEWLKNQKKVSPRIFSLLINLLERKNDNWKDRLSTQQGPLSVQNLQKQHEQEMQQSQQQIAQYEQETKNQKGGRGGKHGNKFEDKNNRNQKNQKYVPVNSSRNNNNKDNGSNAASSADNGKLAADITNTRIKEIWAALDQKTKAGETEVAQPTFEELKKLRNETTAPIFGEALLKTLYDCNVSQKPNRLETAKLAVELLSPAEFVLAFNLRMNKNKDESSDFPMFLSFLTAVFYHLYLKGEVKYSALKIGYKPEYNEDDKFDLMFVYKQFFEDTITDIIKANPDTKGTVAAFVDEQVSPVMSAEDEQYERWAASMKK